MSAFAVKLELRCTASIPPHAAQIVECAGGFYAGMNNELSRMFRTSGQLPATLRRDTEAAARADAVLLLQRMTSCVAEDLIEVCKVPKSTMSESEMKALIDSMPRMFVPPTQPARRANASAVAQEPPSCGCTPGTSAVLNAVMGQH